jgi:hypothetical protein
MLSSHRLCPNSFSLRGASERAVSVAILITP